MTLRRLIAIAVLLAPVALLGQTAPNVLVNTEHVQGASWGASGTPTITLNTTAAPAFAGPSAGMADTVDDAAAGAQGLVYQNRTSGGGAVQDWTFSIYVLKTADATPDFFPAFGVTFENGGTAKYPGVRINTYDGTLAANPSTGGPDSSGVIDVDALWWRIWMVETANTGNLDVGIGVWAAQTHTTISNGNEVDAIGAIVIWGAQVEQASSVGTYRPDPFYSFTPASRSTLMGVGP